MDDSFVRSSTRMSNRAKAVSSMLMFKSESARQLLRSSWNGSGSSENLRTPPDSTDSSPKSFRKKDLDLMPPPSNAMMGRRTRRNDRSKSSSRESSPRSGRKNDINQNVTKASSDSNLPTSESVIM
ncbi:uncharacterized protein LOC131947674 [Physella acuta]|uniref:uncharacterized protein LOC131947674 n=1 Tax=Physella acuta TaxID=109671 RepID=UPI0027DE4155|nr:uncharacterized protein LOC131947674 [Physella acuta]XP_059164917.1 uncharacterized protein LOC131947674 [Physella acuta]